MKILSQRHWCHLLLLMAWLAVGLALRLTNLTAKPLWTDEVATLVFSLGHSYQTVPLNQVISVDTLLQPLQSPPSQTNAVVQHLLSEDTHPPVYFILAHWWMKLFLTADGLVSLWGARLLPALLGAAAIPGVFGLGWLAFRSQLVGQMAAALIAVSPFGVYLAQEARHYTLAILWVIASLSCLVIAMRTIYSRICLPTWLGLTWVGVNSMGMATHYFFCFTLIAEALVLLVQGLMLSWHKGIWLQSHWWRLYAVALGTAVGYLVWLPEWKGIYGNDKTEWIYHSAYIGLNWLNPIAQSLAAWSTMLFLLPIQGIAQPIVIASAVGMVIIFLWVLVVLARGLKLQLAKQPTRSAVQVLAGFSLAAVTIFFCFTYGLGIDLTSTPRYSFVYFPALIVLSGAGLAACWQAPKLEWLPEESQSIVHRFITNGKKAIVLIWLTSLLGGLVVVENLGYQQIHRPDLFIHTVEKLSRFPVLIAIANRNLEQTGKMISLAWELRRIHPKSESGVTDSLPHFLLADQNQEDYSYVNSLQRTLAELSRPLDLWLVSFHPSYYSRALATLVEAQACIVDSRTLPKADGYEYRLYHCYQDTKSQTIK